MIAPTASPLPPPPRPAPLRFEATGGCSGTQARLGRLQLRHGEVETPAFMPVGTYGAVKGLDPTDLQAAGAQIVLANAFHLYTQPGAELIERLGGLHRLMAWDRPILTDSGGFQVFSLDKLRKIDEGGVTFHAPRDGSLVRLTPETVVAAQVAYGVDIAMVLDDCVALPAPKEKVVAALERTLRWAERARAVSRDPATGPALFGIVQGGLDLDLRARCAAELRDLDFDGYALGGLSVGEGMDEMVRVVSATAPLLPGDKPRYLMGVGYPEDLVEAVAAGIDLFDCVLPTRNARNGHIFTSGGRLNIKNARFRDDPRPLDPHCACACCTRFTRAWLRHMFQQGEALAARLLSIHNVQFWLETMRGIRSAIVSGTFPRLLEQARRRRDGVPPSRWALDDDRTEDTP